MANRTARYERVLLKLSGEILRGEGPDCLEGAALAAAGDQLAAAHATGVQLGVVIGGGNIFRGLPGVSGGVARTAGDGIGMLATCINSLALAAVLEARNVRATVLSAVSMPKVAELATAARARALLAAGQVVIFAGGTGNPFFTTDSAAALRACEIEAAVLLKATKVDGIYDADPRQHPEARRFERLTYSEAIAQRLKIMDATAFALCRDNHIPILVFNYFRPGELARALNGEKVGTWVTE